MTAPELSPSLLRTIILDTLRVAPGAPWYVAYSGGLDSTVLLHCLNAVAAGIPKRLVALHADHGLSPNAAAWRAHCERRCREWDIECRSVRLELAGKGGAEARARHARYRWFREVAGDDGWVFTAHHRGDQAETVIERLTRGAGPRGLRAIRPVSRVGEVNVAHPLTGFPREALREYAERHELDWVTDESNTDVRFTRNYIRRRVLPVLAERWGDIEATLATTADAMADAQTVLEQVAESDLRELDDRAVRGDPSLFLPALRALGPARQRNALRYWLQRERGVSPGFRRLARIQHAIDVHPEPAGGLTWPPIDLRIHDDRLYVVNNRARYPDAVLPWDLKADLRIDETRALRARPVAGGGLKSELLRDGVIVTFRKGGEKCRLPGRDHHHSLKHILQEARVPPWQRPDIPLITVNGEIAAITGVTPCAPYAAAPDEAGVEIDIIYDLP